MGEADGHVWIDSKEVLERSAISRATLNNYIKLGVIPRPVVKRSAKNTKRTKKIGFFPASVLDTIDEVKRLKKKGKAMDDIAKEVRPNAADTEDRRKNMIHFPSSDQRFQTPVELADGGIRLTLDEIKTPAYLLNYEFEIEWINKSAESALFGKPIRSIRDVEQRNIFRLFLSWEFSHFVLNWEEFIAFHMAFYKTKTPKEHIHQMYSGISGREVNYLESAYNNTHKITSEKIYRSEMIIQADGKDEKYLVYTTFFREGMFFLYEKASMPNLNVPEFLSHRETVVRDLLQQRLPTLVSFSVLVADLQNSVRICAELPPEEYFELINTMWRILEDSFKTYNGIYGKRIGDGVVYYFLKKQDPAYLMNSVKCALAIRQKMEDFSAEWKARKRWLNDLHLNIGINEGQEYFSTTSPSSTNIEFTALGDTINYASRLSNLARFGSILTTKNVINHLEDNERNIVRYGITKRIDDRDIFIENVFSRVDDLLKDEAWRQRFADIATLPVTEIAGAK